MPLLGSGACHGESGCCAPHTGFAQDEQVVAPIRYTQRKLDRFPRPVLTNYSLRGSKALCRIKAQRGGIGDAAERGRWQLQRVT
jgi:hypothetical protein